MSILRRLDWPLVALVAAALAVLVLAMGPQTFTGERTFSTVDSLEAFEPWRTFSEGQPTNTAGTDPVNGVFPKWEEMRSRLWDGDLPLWSSLLATGNPLLALPQTGSLSPINLPRWFVGAVRAPALVKLLEVLVAGGFTFLFLRRLGLSRRASAVGGIAFAFTGFQIVWQGWQHTQVGALIPAVFWSVERAIQERRLTAMLPVSLATAGILFAGFPAVAIWAMEAAGIYALARVIGTRDGWRDRLRDLGLLAGAVLLGVALTTVQVWPFLDWLADRETGRRDVWRRSHLPWEAILTMAVPEAFGNPVEKIYYGARSFIEQQSYVGIAVLGLAIPGALWRVPAVAARRGAQTFLAVTPIVLGWLVYHGGTLLHAAAVVPPFGTNFVGRQRALIGFFFAALAAIGWHAVVERRGDAPTWWRRALMGLVATVLVAGLGMATVKAAELAGTGERVTYLEGELLGAGIILVIAAVGAALVAFRRETARIAGGVLLVGAILLQGGLFAASYWAKPPAEDVYPVTPAHEFLAGRLGTDRLVPAERAMEPGSTEYYGFPSVIAHIFQPPALADLLRQVDPMAFKGHPTFPLLEPGSQTAGSPVLDRLGARWYAQSDLYPLLGRHTPRPPAVGERRLHTGEQTSRAAPPGAFEGITVEARGIKVAPEALTWLEAEVVGPDGEVLASGRRRLHVRVPTGELDVGLIWSEASGNTAPTGSTVVVEVTGDDAWVELTTDVSGEVIITRVLPAEGPRLGYVGGVHLYERTGALERIRWADEAVVVADAEEAVEFLASGALAPDQVLLATEPEVEDAEGDATLSILEGTGDEIVVDVDASAPGYVVVMDAMTDRGWHAEVDGEAARLLQADHAGAAVAVPEGTHRVRISYRPDSLVYGAVISAGALLVLIAVAVVGWWRRRKEVQDS